MQNYDHEEDHSEKGEAAPTLENQLMQEFEDDYNFAKQQAEINELVISVKAHETGLRRVQKDLEVRVTESQLTETIALINAGIHSDPNIIKLLKTREGYQEEPTDKVQANAQLFSRKLNQMSESLSVLLASIRRLEGRLTVTEADLHAQLNERISSLQTHMEETRGESVKDSMELQQKMEVLSFDVTDKLREVDTKVNWRLTEFKTKIDDKIN